MHTPLGLTRLLSPAALWSRRARRRGVGAPVLLSAAELRAPSNLPGRSRGLWCDLWHLPAGWALTSTRSWKLASLPAEPRRAASYPGALQKAGIGAAPLRDTPHHTRASRVPPQEACPPRTRSRGCARASTSSLLRAWV